MEAEKKCSHHSESIRLYTSLAKQNPFVYHLNTHKVRAGTKIRLGCQSDQNQIASLCFCPLPLVAMERVKFAMG